MPGLLQGYLSKEEQLDSKAFVLPAPESDSAIGWGWALMFVIGILWLSANPGLDQNNPEDRVPSELGLPPWEHARVRGR